MSEVLRRLQQSQGDLTGPSRPSTSDVIQQLQNDNQLAANINRLTEPAQRGPGQTERSRLQLPSALNPSRYTPRYQPYSRSRKGSRQPKEKVYDMKLVVLRREKRLLEKAALQGFSSSYLLESPVRIRERDSDVTIREQLLSIVRQRFPSYDGSFVYVTRPKRTELMKCPVQSFDGKGVHTLKSKGTGNLYVMLTIDVGGDDDVESGESDEEQESQAEIRLRENAARRVSNSFEHYMPCVF